MAWNRRKYTRSLIGMIIIVMSVSYHFSLQGWNFWVVLGSFLIIEHMLVWERWNIYDYITGHEIWGMYILVISLLFLKDYMTMFYVIIGFFIGADYEKFDTVESFKYILNNLIKR